MAQDTVADMAKDMRKNKTGAAQASAAELYDFMKKVTITSTQNCYYLGPLSSLDFKNLIVLGEVD